MTMVFRLRSKARRPEGPKARRPEGPKARRPEGPKARRPEGPKASDSGSVTSAVRAFRWLPLLLLLLPEIALAQVRVVPRILQVNEGEVVSITVELSSRPASTATFSFGGIDGVITAEPTSLTFTTTDWDEPQTVRLTFLEDDDAVDIPLLRVGGYLEIAGVRRFLRSILLVRITDNDKNAPALRFDPQSVTVGEGGSGTYRVRLSSQPTDAVTVAITGQSGTDLMLDNTSLTFTTGDWETDQTVTVSARQDDDGDDDVVTLTHAASGGGYTNVRGNVLVTVTDDDGDKPTVSITGVPAKINSTTALSVAFTFSEAVTGFVTGDVTVTGGTKGAFSGSGTTYTLAVTPSGSADVVVTVAADAATDGGGNTGPAFAVSATAEWDATAPTVSITGVPAKITSRTPFTATFTFSEDVTGFAAGDVTVTGGGTGTLTAVSETTYRLAVTPAGSAHVVVTVAADAATDGGGNTGPASAVSATAVWDAAAPTVEIGGVPAKINSTAALSVAFTFSEAVTGFVTGDVTVAGGTKGAFSGSGREYTLAVTPTSGSNVTVEVAANSATATRVRRRRRRRRRSGTRRLRRSRSAGCRRRSTRRPRSA